MTEVLMFTRAPRLGEVKSRLARQVGEKRALEVHRELGLRLVTALSGEFQLTVVFTPTDALAEMRSWLGDLRFVPQVQGDLGRRMAVAARDAFGRGAQRVIVIGSDAPQVDARIIRRADRALRSAPVVLGPALDGGYYLVGLRQVMPLMFENIDWGTSRVLRQTMERLGAQGVSPELLEPLRDIDTEEDLLELGFQTLDG